MKRADIQIGVEYAETGALAYGREPQVAPKRIRFTSLTPHTWVSVGIVEEHGTTRVSRINRQPTEQKRRTIRVTNRQMVEIAGMPADVLTWEGARAQPVGTEVRYLDTRFSALDKATLPCERYNPDTGAWEDGLARPADVHRTWDEVEQDRRDRARRGAERERPRQALDGQLAALGLGEIAQARLLGNGQVRIAVESEQVEAFLEWAQAREPESTYDPKALERAARGR